MGCALNDNRAMSRITPSPWPVRLTTFLLWALAAAVVVFWSLRLSAPAPQEAAPAMPAAMAAPDAQAIARLLGAVPSITAPVVGQPVAASRYTLVGVLAGRNGSSGAALIAVGGEPARPFRVGAQVDDGLVVQALGKHEARLGASVGGPASVVLDIAATQ